MAISPEPLQPSTKDFETSAAMAPASGPVPPSAGAYVAPSSPERMRASNSGNPNGLVTESSAPTEERQCSARRHEALAP